MMKVTLSLTLTLARGSQLPAFVYEGLLVLAYPPASFVCLERALSRFIERLGM